MSAASTTPRLPYRALTGLALCTLLPSFGMSVATIALPNLTNAFSAPLSSVQWVLLAYMLAMTIVIVGAGRLGDMLGRRQVLLFGVYVFTIGTTVSACAPSLWMLVGARAIQGVGAAIMMALAMAVARESIPEEHTGTAMGLLGTMSAIGTALGPSLGGVLIGSFSWHAIFIVMVPLGLLNVGFLHFGLSKPAERPSQSKTEFDVIGMALLAIALSSFTLALTKGGAFAPILIILTALSAGAFVMVQRKKSAPLIPISALSDKVLNTSFAMNVIVSVVMMATLVVAPFYLAQGLGLTPTLMGLAMSTGPIVSALAGLPAGRLVDRFGPTNMTIAALVQMLVGAIGLIVLPAAFDLLGYILAATLMPPGYQLFLAANNTQVMLRAKSAERGLISALLNLTRNLGLMIGTATMSFAFISFSQLAAPHGSAGRALKGFQLTFGLAAFLIVLCLGLALFSKLNKNSSDQYPPARADSQ